jgi:hypothetical protein
MRNFRAETIIPSKFPITGERDFLHQDRKVRKGSEMPTQPFAPFAALV